MSPDFRSIASSASCLLALCNASAPARAAAGPLQVESRMQMEKPVRAADGSTTVQLAPTQGVGPGAHVLVTLAYRNTGSQPIADVVLTNPVPTGMVYRAPRAGVTPEVTADGRTYAPLSDLRVSGPAGSRPAASADIRQLRWRLAAPVKPGASGQVSFEAEVR